ncbi:Ff.00g007800.m01.CDS01 [Fusarium sp. VM40]|nr:Ff.00g007800.m01.CDS01 [Fusarium sp. VM40]
MYMPQRTFFSDIDHLSKMGNILTDTSAGSANTTPDPVTDTDTGTIDANARFGTMRTRNQFCQKVEEVYKQSPARFHAKIDSAYAQYLAKFNEIQRVYGTRVRDIAGEDCFSGFSHAFPDASLTELIYSMLRDVG